MKLKSFSIKNYRSITKSEKINLSNSLTILVGPNNEGKSNIIRAIVTGMNMLSEDNRLRWSIRHNRGRHRMLRKRSRREDYNYEWDRDFPLQLQASNSIEQTELIFEFSFSESEILNFEKNVGSTLNGTLQVKLTCGRDKEPQIEVIKKGWGKGLNKKKDKIIEFILSRFQIHPIPAKRSTDESLDLVYEMIGENLEEVNDDPIYKECIQKIKELQRPYFEKMSFQIRESLEKFIPGLEEVIINPMEEDQEVGYSNQFDVLINDGVLTDLHYKGDGIQSLAAISLIKLYVERGSKDIILAIDEPEVHLHPKSIRKLKNILDEVSKKQQVIITTHSPLLIDTEKLENNILVSDNRVRPVKNIAEIRELLGVKLPDNLLSAEIVVFVEGENDRKIFDVILRKNKIISDSIREGKLKIIPINGANKNKIEYYSKQFKEALFTKVLFILDYEHSLRGVVEKLKNERSLESNEYVFARQDGLNESELEDMFNFCLYKEKLLEKYAVDIDCDIFRNRREKWTTRVKKCFEACGKDFDELNVKGDVSSWISSSQLDSELKGRNKEFFDSLIKTILFRLQNKI